MPLAAFVFGVLYLIFGARYAPALGAGFFAGYLVYDMTHYYLHHFRPQGRLARMLRERHMRHHFQDDTRGFGISAPYWDEVFGTSSRGARAAAGERDGSGGASRPKARLDSRLESVPTTGTRTSFRKEGHPWPQPTSTGS